MTEHVGMRFFNDFLKATHMRQIIKTQVLRQRTQVLRLKTQGLQQNVKIHSLVFRISARAIGRCRKSLVADYLPLIRQ